ncbi:alkaline phosphatase [Rubrobacter aplysinae]|uniref:alkaline phosphatase n=1 Tax=Rubrobacter aplysinae TaxID=909625 RepID=UPI000A00C04D
MLTGPSERLAQADEADEVGNVADTPTGTAKNVIVFVGDGMGTSHRDLIRYSTVGTEGQLAMDSMPYAGRSETTPRDPEAFVTDSAAGGTAIATGVKTFNGAVGVDENGNTVPSVLEKAGAAGKATGVVTDSQVTDATPASFGAHVEDRDKQSEIARQYLTGSKPDVILGGGEDYWYPEGNAGAFPDEPAADPEEKSAGEEGNLVEQAQGLGYEYITDAQSLQSASGSKLLGLFANEEMFQAGPEDEGASYDPSVPLPEMTEKAIGTLSQNPEGFFLMVEGEGIDEMAHQSNAPLTVEAGQALDGAVGVAKSYAESHPDTLVIVTADHETGGLAIEDTNEIQDDPDYPNESGEGRTAEDGPFPVANSDAEFLVDWTTANHSAEDVPVTAMGPGGESLVGVYENTHIHDAMLASLGLQGSGAGTGESSEAIVMPDTGGMGLGSVPDAMLLLFAGALGGLGLLVSLRYRGSRRR